MILAGDIGGTKTHLGLFEPGCGPLSIRRQQMFDSRNYSGLEEILQEFLDEESARLDAACFGVAGPVLDGRVQMPNLPWHLDETELCAALGIERVVLLNDLVATAEGLEALMPDDLYALQRGQRLVSGNAALIAAGTGLGMCILARVGSELVPLASEGGHMDFAPTSADEVALLEYLQARHTHVSYERVASGPGLASIYEFYRDRGAAVEQPQIRGRMEREDPSAVIGEAAISGACKLSRMALTLWETVLGAAAGNLALMSLATGGVFVGGGIAPKILSSLQRGVFRTAFCSKGRFAFLLERVPVQVVLNQQAAFLGAARYAYRNV